ncbi:MAG: 1-(5-phosphoribosyl)-5-[(5-phosphoribosylamino)methylideneamino]imidazole-4-carboxamide isomerase [Armatimonadota bacterium]
MELIPAIDLIDGKCVRLMQGDFNRVEIYSDNPAEVAKKWAQKGAHRLHIVDLNGSKVGKPLELSTITKIVNKVDVPVQVGGGIRSLETAYQLINIGVERVIFGTSVALNHTFAEKIFGELQDKAILGVDAKNGKVAIKGWEETIEDTAIDFALKMQNLGARRVIYTDISKDGMLEGANIEATKKLAEALNIPIIASGGVSSILDIKQLSQLENIGIEGAILGKALYTGKLSLEDALSVL